MSTKYFFIPNYHVARNNVGMIPFLFLCMALGFKTGSSCISC